MRNILSYQPETKFTGEEIVNWSKFQVENKTSHAKQGDYILKHFKLIPYNEYYIKTSYRGTGCGKDIRQLLILKVLSKVSFKSY